MNKEIILIVDDEPINIKLIAQILSDKYDLRVSTNGKDALKVAKNNKLDLILLDIFMPIMDGFEVAQELKLNDNTKNIPIIFITANTDEENIEKAYLSGGSDYITKPFKAKEFLARVDRELKLNYLIKSLDFKTKELELLNKNLEERVKKEVESNMQKEKILIQQTKMAEMGSMIGTIAHQWKQPLNTLSIMCKNIVLKHQKGSLDSEAMKKIEDKAKDQIHFMAQTIDDFRNFFKPSKQKKAFSIKDILLEVIKLLNAKIKESYINIVINENEDFLLFGYPNELKQVILNIINNSIDVLNEKKINDAEITILIKSSDNIGFITFKDNGGGISNELLPDKLFEAYVTTKGDEGTGIGLQISKTIIENNMGGKISATNVDNGAEFKIEVPIYKES